MSVNRNIFIYLCIIWYHSGFVFGNSINTDLKLELVQVLFRHGARTPLTKEASLVPQYNESFYEPRGFAQLTKEGMNQEYEIGKMLRKRYKDFLPDLYRSQDLYAYTSKTERTFASLQLVLAALYPPVDELKWNENLNWTPIPINSISRSLDILAKPRNCPKYIKSLQDVYRSEDVRKSSNNTQIIREISEIFGKSINHEELFQLYNLLKINKSLKVPLPVWYTDELFDNLEKAAYSHLNVLSSTNTLKRLNGGPFVRRFLENIMDSNSRTSRKKIYLYSAHEKTLHAYLSAHNLTNFTYPEYGSTVILEKYRSASNQYYIKLLYWTGEPRKMNVFKLKNCPEICPLEVYTKIIQPSLPSNDEMLCLLKNLKPKDLEKYLNEDFGR